MPLRRRPTAPALVPPRARKPPVVTRMDSRRRSTAPSGPSAGSNPGVIQPDNASGRHLRAAESQTGIRGPSVFSRRHNRRPANRPDRQTRNELTVHTAQHATSGPTTDPSHPPQGFATADPAAEPPSETTLLPLTELDDEIERLGVPVPCRTYDPEVFFAESPADVEYAKSLCQTCPVLAACLAG